MKKLLIVLLILLSSIPVFSSVSFGYSLAPVGAMTPTGNYGALTRRYDSYRKLRSSYDFRSVLSI